MKSGSRILVAKDLSIIKVIHVCVHVCIHACTHTPVDHRVPLCTLGKGAPSGQKQPQGNTSCQADSGLDVNPAYLLSQVHVALHRGECGRTHIFSGGRGDL